MKILPDSRQIPKGQEYTANKMYTDIVYAWLQVNSKREEETNIRWIAKKDVKFVDMANELGITRQTASTKFKKLLAEDGKGNKGLGLITFNAEKNRYELQLLPDNVAMLIQQKTLRKMIAALNQNTISVYVYLLSRYIANDEHEFEFTLEQVKSFIGLGTGGRSNNYIITDILSILKTIGLIDYKLMDKVDKNGIRSVYVVERMSNKIPDC